MKVFEICWKRKLYPPYHARRNPTEITTIISRPVKQLGAPVVVANCTPRFVSPISRIIHARRSPVSVNARHAWKERVRDARARVKCTRPTRIATKTNHSDVGVFFVFLIRISRKRIRWVRKTIRKYR